MSPDAKPLPFLSPFENGSRLQLRVQPGASRSAISGFYGKALKIAIKAPPVDGKANDALIEFIAEIFALPKRDVRLLSGETSRDKAILLTTLGPDRVAQILANKIPLR